MKDSDRQLHLNEIAKHAKAIGSTLKPNSPEKTQEIEGLAFAVSQLAGRQDNVQTLFEMANRYVETPVRNDVLKMVGR